MVTVGWEHTIIPLFFLYIHALTPRTTQAHHPHTAGLKSATTGLLQSDVDDVIIPFLYFTGGFLPVYQLAVITWEFLLANW